MTTSSGTTRNFVSEFRERCRIILHEGTKRASAPIAVENFDHFQVVKKKGDVEKVVATGITLHEAKILMKACVARLNPLHEPNDSGEPYFELEIYKVTIAGRERYQERPQARFLLQEATK